MSDASPNAADLALRFDTRDTPFFHVEWTESGSDLVYHFWPPGDECSFPRSFSRHLEDAFIAVLPSDQKVKASFTNLEEATIQHAHDAGAVPAKDAERAIVFPRETYYVRVVDGLKNPLSDIFLKGRVFEQLLKKIKEND